MAMAMALKLSSVPNAPSRARSPFHGSSPAVPLFRCIVPLQLLPSQVRTGSSRSSIVTALKKEDSNTALLAGAAQEGFNPFKEIQREDLEIPVAPHVSLARHLYDAKCELALNHQINVEYSVSYVYHAMYAYFSRDNIALHGIAKFFKESSVEEREHAQKLIEYQNKRGGKARFHHILKPVTEFDNSEKGDALNAMEIALALEKVTNQKLLNLHKMAKTFNDTQMEDYLESEFLTEQVESIKKIAEYVAQLRRVGKGHGVWHFDQMLLQQVGPA